jgi:hypothetical protein
MKKHQPMSTLRPGQRCVIIAGCPENIGLIVEVIEHLGAHDGRADAYEVRTTSGRKFLQLWHGNDLLRGNSEYAITDRHKLRPLVDPKEVAPELAEALDQPSEAVA